MQTNQHWENVLTTIKKRGKRKLRARKTFKAASLALVVFMGTLFFLQKPQLSDSFLASQTQTSYEVALLMEDAGFYDDEWGFISD